jgi:putative flippase GtrA
MQTIPGQQEMTKGAMINGLINMVINGMIAWFGARHADSILLTDNQISSTAHTVFSGAVVTAISLAFILSSIAYLTWKIPGKPSYFPTVLLICLRHTIFTFGLVVALAILIQRYAGAVPVSPFLAALITGAIAGVTAGIVTYLTQAELIKHQAATQ